MILNIDFNPGIDRCLYLENIIVGENNTLESSEIRINGSAAILEYLLNMVNESSILTGFLGDKNKDIYRSLLPNNVKTAFVHIKDDLYERIRIIDSSGLETSFDTIPRITKEEVTEFINGYYTLLERCDYIVGFDNITDEIPEDLYEKLVKISSIEGKKMILEIVNEKTIKSIDKKPDIVVTDKKTLEKISNLSLAGVSDMSFGVNHILAKGVKKVFINLYDNGYIYADDHIKYHVSGEEKTFKKEENHGLIASILIGLKRGYELEMFLKMCHSYNKVYNTEDDIVDISRAKLKKNMSSVEIIEI